MATIFWGTEGTLLIKSYTKTTSKMNTLNYSERKLAIEESY